MRGVSCDEYKQRELRSVVASRVAVSVPQGLKPLSTSKIFMARLKPCPFKGRDIFGIA